MVFHLDAGRYAPAVARYQAEHVAEAVHHQCLVLVAPVGQSDAALAHRVVGVIGMHVLAASHAAWQVHIVHRYLRERELPVVAVHVGHLLVHEAGVCQQRVLDEQLVLGHVQNIVDGGLAQCLRLAVLQRKVVRAEQFASLGVVHLQFATYEAQVHLVHMAVVGLIGQHGQPQYQPLRLVVHLTRALVAELTAYQARVALFLELGHLLTKSKGGCWQRVAVLLFQYVDGLGHHVPVVCLAHHRVLCLRAVVKGHGRAYHACVHSVLPYVPPRQLNAALRRVGEEGVGALVVVVVLAHPVHQPHDAQVGIGALHGLLHRSRQRVHGHKGVVA